MLIWVLSILLFLSFCFNTIMILVARDLASEINSNREYIEHLEIGISHKKDNEEKTKRSPFL